MQLTRRVTVTVGRWRGGLLGETIVVPCDAATDVGLERGHCAPADPQVTLAAPKHPTSVAAAAPYRALGGLEDEWFPPACPPPEVSVVVRCWNANPAWLEAAVDSALASKGVSVEVLLVDDGSETPVTPWPDPRCGLLRHAYNKGLAEAHNTGTARCRGEFIRFLDDDDLLPPDALAAQVACLRANPQAAMVAGRLRFIGAPDTPSPQAARLQAELRRCDGDLARAVLESADNLLAGPSVLWRRAADIVPTIPRDFVTAEDGAFYRTLLARDPRAVVWLDHCVLEYRVREGSNSGCGRSPQSRLRNRACLERVSASRRLVEHDTAARAAARPLKVAVIGDASHGGAQWALAQTLRHVDRRLVEPAWFAPLTTPLTAWLVDHGVPVVPRPDGVPYAEWLPGAVSAWGADLADTVWSAAMVTPELRAAVPRLVGHLQSQSLVNARLGPGAEALPLYDRFLAVAPGVVADNPHLADRATVIPSPVDSAVLRRAATTRAATRALLGVADNECLVVWSGRLVAYEKKFETYQKTVEALAGTPRLRWLLLGSLDPAAPIAAQDRQDWRGWCEAHGVLWFSDLWSWDCPAFYAASDVFLSTSQIEGLSLAMLEAVAAGCYPVVTNVSGVPLVVEDGLSGTVVDRPLAEAVVPALRGVLAMDPAERLAAAALARHLAAARCDVRLVARDTALAWRDIATSGPQTGRAASAAPKRRSRSRTPKGAA